MKHIEFNIEKDGFYGDYWPCKEKNSHAMIAMIGDDSKDYLARCAVKWLHKKGLNVLTTSPGKKDYGHHNYPLERIQLAISKLKEFGNNKIGIVGASTTATLALTAASFFNDITLTIALTPSDFIWQGFMQGNKDGCKEWPVENESLFTYNGKPLPYMPFVYKHPQYWQVIAEETKQKGDMIASRKIFDDSEKAYGLNEDEMIKVENIKGQLVIVGAKDDALWDTVKYIERMKERLKKYNHNAEILIYDHGTHFVFPQGMMKIMLPVGSNLFVSMAFKAAREYPKQCKQTRIDLENKITKVIADWKNKS